MSYVYLRSEPGLWTVGFYSPEGEWHAASDHGDETKAANEVVRLNGGKAESPLEKAAPSLLAALRLYVALDNRRHAGAILTLSEWGECHQAANTAIAKANGG